MVIFVVISAIAGVMVTISSIVSEFKIVESVSVVIEYLDRLIWQYLPAKPDLQ